MTGTFAREHGITYRLCRPRRHATRLWTVQPYPVWARLLREHSLVVDPAHPSFNQDFCAAYDWMREQMHSRLPDYENHYPWWAYDARVDLRSFRYQVGPGPHVLLALALPPERALLSAYGAWHAVLGQRYLPDAASEDAWERDGETWDEELMREGLNPRDGASLPEPWQSRMRASWNCIFSVERLRETNTIQACFERLDLADVLEVTKFSSAIRTGAARAAANKNMPGHRDAR